MENDNKQIQHVTVAKMSKISNESLRLSSQRANIFCMHSKLQFNSMH